MLTESWTVAETMAEEAEEAAAEERRVPDANASNCRREAEEAGIAEPSSEGAAIRGRRHIRPMGPPLTRTGRHQVRPNRSPSK